MILLPPTTQGGSCDLLIFNRSLRDVDGGGPETFKVRRISAGTDFQYLAQSTVDFETGTGDDYHELFCAGHTLTADGKVFFAGGHHLVGNAGNDHGIKHTYLFDPGSNTFTPKSVMWEGRWYPTVLPLPDRQLLIVGGTYSLWEFKDGVWKWVAYENWNPSLWIGGIPDAGNPDFQSKLPTANTTVYYPHIFIDPKSGRPFHTPHGRYINNDTDFVDGTTLFYDPVTSAWTDEGAPLFPTGANVERTYPSGVMVDGMIVKNGGAKHLDGPDDAVKRTLYIDMNAQTPAWVVGPEMNAGRMNHTLVGLPDGKVMAFNGSNDSQYDTDAQEIADRVQPEMFDTKALSQGWVKLALPPLAGRIPRGYHSTKLLNPDATVVIGGGELANSTGRKLRQIFSPPYGGANDWKLTRPSITSAPADIRYGEPFTVNGALHGNRQVSKITLISLGATTHAFNQNQTINTLPHLTAYAQGQAETQSGSQVTWQTRHKYMPPGYYMLFLVDSAGIPSVAKIVKLLDVDRTLMGSGTLSNGSTFRIPAYPRDLALGDQLYLGGYILADAFALQTLLTATGTAPSTTATKFSVYCEFKTDRTMDYDVLAYNYATSTFDSLGTGTATVNQELGIEVSAPDTFPQPYIASNNQIQIRVRWSDNSGGYKVYVDRIEVRTR